MLREHVRKESTGQVGLALAADGINAEYHRDAG
jgi:hypothetical protein